MRLHCTGLGGKRIEEVHFAATYTPLPVQALTITILPPPDVPKPAA
ncbi:MAG: hypothetical protein ACTHJX_03865 [Terriglobales bacterium]|jgi:hypothetical protein